MYNSQLSLISQSYAYSNHIQEMAINLTLSNPEKFTFSDNKEQQQSLTVDTLWKRRLRDQLGKIVVETMQTIAKDTFFRMQNCFNPSDLQLLEGGIWYQNDYYVALARLSPLNASSAQRLEILRNHNCFYNIYASDFESIPSQNSLTGVERTAIRIRKEVKPSEALNGLLKGKKLALLDCLTVVQIAQYEALHQVLGDKKFNKLFDHSSQSPLTFGFKNALTSFRKSSDMPAVGQLTGALNIHQYEIKHHLMGNFASINLVISDVSDLKKVKYAGFGISSQGATQEEIEGMLVHAYNISPLDAFPLSDQVVNKITGGREFAQAFNHLMSDSSKCNQLTLETLLIKIGMSIVDAKQRIQGWVKMPKVISLGEAKQDSDFGFIKETTDFDIDLIAELVRLPIENVSMSRVRAFHLSKAFEDLEDSLSTDIDDSEYSE